MLSASFSSDTEIFIFLAKKNSMVCPVEIMNSSG